MRQSLAITVVFFLLWLCLWLLRKKGLLAAGGRFRMREPHRDLELLERLSLTPQHSLQTVRIGDRRIVVAVHPGGMAVLSEIQKDPE